MIIFSFLGSERGRSKLWQSPLVLFAKATPALKTIDPDTTPSVTTTMDFESQKKECDTLM